jgi:serine/threonine protein kinase
MNELRQSHIVRFITAFQRGKQDDMEHYVIFEWADGGNLGDFWRFWDEQPGPRLTPSTMWWVVKQFHGLAQALKSAHYLAGGASYRHGDLKPANILWFREPGGYGQLKIGDWGEAKSHKQVTALRHNTTAKFGTRRYEPPETGLQSSLPPEDRHVRSRLYDIWGIGCIALEFIIWLLYGQKGLARFNSSNQGDYGISEMFYEVSPNRTAKIHRVVTHWMDHMAKDPLCRVSETALGSLLQVVRTGLLVVDLPDGGGADPQAHCDQSSSTHTTSPPGGTHIPIPSMDRGGMTATETPPTVSIEITQADTTDSVTDNVPNWSETRFRATELETKLREIMNAKRAEVYWYQALKPKPSPVDSGGSSYLSVSTKSIARNTNTKSTGRLVDDYGHPVLDPEDWTFIVDNDFAAILMSELEKANKSPTQRTSLTTRLCRRCMDFREQLLNANFESTYNPHTLQQNADAKTCELCCLLWQAYKDNKTEDVETIRFWRDRSTLKMNGAKHPVLTLFRRNGKPVLGNPDPASRSH